MGNSNNRGYDQINQRDINLESKEDRANKLLRSWGLPHQLYINLVSTPERELITSQILSLADQKLSADTDDKLREGIKNSIIDLIKRFNFQLSSQHYSTHYELKDPAPFTGYKLVRLYNTDQKRIDMDCFAMLQLAIWDVRDSVTGVSLQANQLTSSAKYCTNAAMPVKSWLIGPHKLLKERIKAVRESKTQFVSNFNAAFVYEFEKRITEPNFGQPGKGCIQGIHFFIDRKAAFRYIKTGFTSVDRSRLTMCGNITCEDIIELVDAAMNAPIEPADPDVEMKAAPEIVADLKQHFAGSIPPALIDRMADVVMQPNQIDGNQTLTEHSLYRVMSHIRPNTRLFTRQYAIEIAKEALSLFGTRAAIINAIPDAAIQVM